MCAAEAQEGGSLWTKNLSLEAFEKMEVGPPKSAFECRLQTPSSGCGKELLVVSIEEKSKTIRQVGIRKTNESKPLLTRRYP